MSCTGFSYCNAGLTNQKIAILGLVYRALDLKKNIFIPDIRSYDPSLKGIDNATQKFHEIFDQSTFDKFLHDVNLRSCSDLADEVDAVKMFENGATLVRFACTDQQSVAKSYFASIRPSAPLVHTINSAADHVFNKLGVRHILQFRFESDWVSYVRNHVKPHRFEDNSISINRIFTRLFATLADRPKSIYFTCHEPSIALNKNDIKDYIFKNFSCEVFFKSDIPVDGLSTASFAEQTVIDFELALRAPVFIGTCRSTFANMLSTTKYAIQNNDDFEHYIYNVAADTLLRRRDRGAGLAPEAIGDVHALSNLSDKCDAIIDF